MQWECGKSVDSMLTSVVSVCDVQQSKALVQKKEEGNVAFKANKLDVALALYTEALAIDKNNVLVNSKIYCNRALVHSKVSWWTVLHVTVVTCIFMMYGMPSLNNVLL